MAFSDFASIEASKNRKAIEAVAAGNGQIIEQLGNINHKLGQLIDSAKKGIAILERQSKEGQQPASKKPRRCKSEESESHGSCACAAADDVPGINPSMPPDAPKWLLYSLYASS